MISELNAAATILPGYTSQGEKKTHGRRQLGKTMNHYGDPGVALLKLAEEIIRESGGEGLTLRACARGAGVSQGMPAQQFGKDRWIAERIRGRGFNRPTEAMGLEKIKDADDELQAADWGTYNLPSLARAFPSDVA